MLLVIWLKFTPPLLTFKFKTKKLKHVGVFFPFLLVALNFQTAGEGMDLNDGLFSQNGGYGYVLKPSFMRETEKRWDPETPQKRDCYQPVVLTIQVQTITEVRKHVFLQFISYVSHCGEHYIYVLKVISGQQLPKVNIKEDSIVDPLVRVEIHGVPMDQAKQETRYIENNGTGGVVSLYT